MSGGKESTQETTTAIYDQVHATEVQYSSIPGASEAYSNALAAQRVAIEALLKLPKEEEREMFRGVLHLLVMEGINQTIISMHEQQGGIK
ncbi:MAG: hypothetical protein QG629_159 [Patescibacteria group bacterium]|nr:hypothetical protein [Candidatus Saccharibacteria bacterium]MDQ5963077.1 hypothetical protein [Patescibacteria group bacterium]